MTWANALQAPAPAVPPVPAAGAGEVRAAEGPPRSAGGGGSFGASMHAQALARRRAMGDEPRPRVRAPPIAHNMSAAHRHPMPYPYP